MKRIDPLERACSAFAALTGPQLTEFRIWLRGYEMAMTGRLPSESARRPGRPAGSRNKAKDAPVEGASA